MLVNRFLEALLIGCADIHAASTNSIPTQRMRSHVESTINIEAVLAKVHDRDLQVACYVIDVFSLEKTFEDIFGVPFSCVCQPEGQSSNSALTCTSDAPVCCPDTSSNSGEVNCFTTLLRGLYTGGFFFLIPYAELLELVHCSDYTEGPFAGSSFCLTRDFNSCDGEDSNACTCEAAFDDVSCGECTPCPNTLATFDCSDGFASNCNAEDASECVAQSAASVLTTAPVITSQPTVPPTSPPQETPTEAAQETAPTDDNPQPQESQTGSPTTSPTANPTASPTSNPMAIPTTECFIAMNGANTNNDDLLNQNEYFNFVNILGDNSFQGENFAELPVPFRQNYFQWREPEINQIIIFGSESGQDANAEQMDFLDTVCSETQALLDAEPTTAPSLPIVTSSPTSNVTQSPTSSPTESPNANSTESLTGASPTMSSFGVSVMTSPSFAIAQIICVMSFLHILVTA